MSTCRSQYEEGEELVAIWCRSVDATHDSLPTEYRAELEGLVCPFLPEVPLWVVVNERDQPVGSMLLSGQRTGTLFTDPDVRGCDVGRMLVEHALSMAPELATSVNEQSEQAIGFHKKVGFKATGHSKVDDLGKPYSLPSLAYVGGQAAPAVPTQAGGDAPTPHPALFSPTQKGHRD